MKRLTVCVAIVVVLTLAAKGWEREWKDTAGKFSVEAEFAGMEGDSIVKLEKENGEIVKVPLLGLDRKDREYVDWAIGIETANAVVRDIHDVFQGVYYETSATARIVEREALDKLVSRFNKKRLTLVFPIENVSPWRSETYPPRYLEGLYTLHLGKPFPDRSGTGTHKTKLGHVYSSDHYQTTWSLPLTKETVLAIN